MYVGGMGAGIATTAAIVLPNTGSNHGLAFAATIGLVVGVAVMLSSAARLIAKKVYKA